jgi:hypothetical protein
MLREIYVDGGTGEERGSEYGDKLKGSHYYLRDA